MVYSGDFIKYCFKPINIFFYFISEIFDVKGIGQLIFGIATLTYAWMQLELSFSLIVFIKLLVGLFAASLFMIAIMNFAASFCFYMINAGFVMILFNKFKDYARYPITIFNGIFRVIFTFIIPIAFMAYYPSLEFIPDKEPVFLTYFTPL
jgi:ABC-2 type transport system permease protein